MNPKIIQLQQRNAQARLRQRYAFLNIADIQSTDGDIARRFVDSGIYRLLTQPQPLSRFIKTASSIARSTKPNTKPPAPKWCAGYAPCWPIRRG